MNKRKVRLYKALIMVTVLAIVALISSFLILNRQSIYDSIALLNYHPPSDIATLANQAGMNSYTRKVFYVNHPQLQDKSTFAKNCPGSLEQTAVLGCYHSNQQGIYILAVNNAELYGIEQVTAAYETLHAIYQRLSPSDQAKLNTELLNFEKNGLNNPVVETQIADFKKTEPGGVLNEMTSLFGTEVENLPAGLNSFYARYFTNRQVLLNYYNSYETAFTSRQAQIAAYDSQLNSLHAIITSNEAELNSRIAQINNEQSALTNERSSGQIEQYNAAVPSYNSQVDSYNSLAQNTSSLVNQYNQIVDQRNSIVLTEQQLTQAITSSPQQLTGH